MMYTGFIPILFNNNKYNNILNTTVLFIFIIYLLFYHHHYYNGVSTRFPSFFPAIQPIINNEVYGRLEKKNIFISKAHTI